MRPTRRGFLRQLGAGVLGTGVLAGAGCRDGGTDPLARATIALGRPSGLLNLVYVYAQFMADFYARAASVPIGPVSTSNFVGMTVLEFTALTALAGHKNAQRAALTSLIHADRVPDVLLFDFTALDFSSRASVMGHAQEWEDLGVAALNGLARTLHDATDLTLVAKIASSWARHAAVIRDLNDVAAGKANTAGRTAFAATVSPDGLDRTADPAAVLAAIQPYVRTQLATS